MKLKNAGFESELDMMTALVGGETVYFDIYILKIDELQSISLKFDGGRLLISRLEYTGRSTPDIGGLMLMYNEAKVECEWHENITKLVPCWVWNVDRNDKDIALIDDYVAHFEYKFRDTNDSGWMNAIPMEPSDLLGGDDDSE